MPHFLIRSIAAAGVADVDDPDLDEQHWSYTDPYAATMIARGPTLDRARREWTGSIHILDLPDLSSVRRYIENEPYHRAGAYRDHDIWRFDDHLGRTMWDTARIADHTRYFVLTDENCDVEARTEHWRSGTADRLVVLGSLRDPSTDAPRGVALAAQLPSRNDLESVLQQTIGPPASHGPLDVIDWELGGRR
ncbi:YciI family protein [Kribbella sp. NPDC051952]|uniref:YciI family protein n=1 Tax=Kribbella sp. NPDC051952 TaxID=3154851 RepID=UPI003420B5E6